jgi:hypothetical protein
MNDAVGLTISEYLREPGSLVTKSKAHVLGSLAADSERLTIGG